VMPVISARLVIRLRIRQGGGSSGAQAGLTAEYLSEQTGT
jgi:hypothetical protein